MIVPARPLLTTDYLNHFSELVMLLEMAHDVPEAFDDARAWAPRSYEDHLGRMDSAKADALLSSYRALDCERRAMLEETSANANRLGAALVSALRDPQIDARRLSGILHLGCGALHAHIRRLSAIIAGRPPAEIDMPAPDLQSQIDELLAAA